MRRHYTLISLLFSCLFQATLQQIISLDRQIYGNVIMDFDPIQTVFKYCRIHRQVNSPLEHLGAAAQIALTFNVDRIFDIDDVSESFAVNGAMVIQYGAPCLKALYAKNDTWLPPFAVLKIPSRTFWSPELFHRNALKSTPLTDEYFRITTDAIMPMGVISQVVTGRYESFCDLDLFLFPFDS